MLVNWYKWVVLKNYANFNGRASRAEFWYYVLDNFIIAFLIGIILIISPTAGSVLYGIYALAVLIPGLAVSARRLQDIGKSGWNLLWGLVPIVGAILLLVWYLKAGDAEDNKYGPVPPQTPPDEVTA